MAANLYTSSSRLPWACIVSIVLVLALQVAFSVMPQLQSFLYTFSEPFHSDPIRVSYLRAEAKAQSEQDDKFHVHLVGASQTREGLDPRIMNERLADEGIVFHNLGAAAYSAMDFYMEVDSIIDSRPDLVVYMPYVGTFFLDYQFSRLRFYFDPVSISLLQDELGDEVLLKNRKAIFDSYVSYLLYFYKNREGIRAIFFNFVNYLAFNLGEEPEVKLYNYTEAFPDKYFEKQFARYKGNKFYVSEFTPVEKEAFLRAMDRLKSSGIPVLVLDAPGNPLISRTYKPEVRIDYDAFLRREVIEPGIPFLSLSDIPQFGKEDFIDFTHLTSDGRERLSNFLADYIRENRPLFEREQPE